MEEVDVRNGEGLYIHIAEEDFIQIDETDIEGM